MDVNAGGARLMRGLKNLLVAWDEASEKWRDERHDQFEEKYILPYQEMVREVLRELDRLNAEVTAAQQECE